MHAGAAQTDELLGDVVCGEEGISAGLAQIESFELDSSVLVLVLVLVCPDGSVWVLSGVVGVDIMLAGCGAGCLGAGALRVSVQKSFP